MTELIAYLSTGKGSWGEVAGLISKDKFEKIYLLTNDFGKENFNSNEKTELLVIDTNQNILGLRDQILTIIKSKINGTEIAVNFVSGSGKEHMSLVSALIKSGLGFRLVTADKGDIQEL